MNKSDTTPAPVTAVVLNWCNEADTAVCLESLAAARYGALTVLLVDNGSPDGSGERLRARFPNVAYLQTGSNVGYAGGNNRGMRWALDHGAAFVLVLNNDTVVDPECVARLVGAAEETGAAVVAPQIRYFDAPDKVWYGGGDFSKVRAVGVHRLENHALNREQVRSVATFVTGCSFLIRSDTLRAVGGFDESFFAYVEDAELSLRLTRAGCTMLYEPSALVLHRIAPRAVETPFQIVQRDRNRRKLVARHYRAPERMLFALWFYPTRGIHFARYLARGDWARARSIVIGAVGQRESGANL